VISVIFIAESPRWVTNSICIDCL